MSDSLSHAEATVVKDQTVEEPVEFKQHASLTGEQTETIGEMPI